MTFDFFLDNTLFGLEVVGACAIAYWVSSLICNFFDRWKR